MSPRVKFFLGVLLFLSVASVTRAQVTEQQVNEALSRMEPQKSKALLLRSLCPKSTMHFDQSGKLEGDCAAGTWTTDGWVSVQKARTSKNEITLEVKRLSVFFKEPPFTLMADSERRATIVMPRPADEAELQHLLGSIFFRRDEPFVSSLPPLWVDYFNRKSKTEDQPKVEPPQESRPYRVGGGVTAPKALHAPDPSYSEVARKAKHQGIVVLWLIVGPDGRAHNIRLVRALGLGLDERAVAAVEGWRFDPARKDGQPVAVQINVEINFRLY